MLYWISIEFEWKLQRVSFSSPVQKSVLVNTRGEMDILKSLGHPEEIINLFKYKIGGCRSVMPKLDYVSKCILSVHL